MLQRRSAMRQAPTTPQGAAPTALLLLTNLQRVFTCTAPLPGALEPTAILVGGGKVLALLTDAEAAAALAALPQLISQLDATGLIAVPGFIDIHAHICGECAASALLCAITGACAQRSPSLCAAGGGGEAGPSSRTPEARLSQLLLAGMCCVAARPAVYCWAHGPVQPPCCCPSP